MEVPTTQTNIRESIEVESSLNSNARSISGNDSEYNTCNNEISPSNVGVYVSTDVRNRTPGNHSEKSTETEKTDSNDYNDNEINESFKNNIHNGNIRSIDLS